MENKNGKEINIKITLGWVISARRHDLGYTQHEMARAVGISDFTVSRIESNDGITPDNNTLRKIAEYLKIDYNSLLTLKPVGVKLEMQLNQREIKNMNVDQKDNTMTILQSAFSDAFASDGGGKDCYVSDEQSDLERRLVLFVNGMSDDFFLLLTDAPQKYIEEYCKWYNKWIENGGQGDFLGFLRKKYYVNLLIDSETGDKEELEVITDGKKIEFYDLFRYWDDK